MTKNKGPEKKDLLKGRKKDQCCNVQKKKGPVLQCSEEKRSSVAMFTASTSIKSQRERRPLEGLAGLFCSPEKREVQRRGLYYIETPGAMQRNNAEVTIIQRLWCDKLLCTIVPQLVHRAF